MAATVFKQLVNNLLTTLGASYTAGSGSMTLASGAGALFGSVDASHPVRFTVITAATYGTASEVLAIDQATGRTGDTLTGVTAIEGTSDRAFASGDKVEVRPTAGCFSDMYSAINALETGGAGVFGAAGAGHSTGLVPDPGASAHNPPKMLGDDGAFHGFGGAGISYSAPDFTISGGGGGGTPGGSSGDVQYNNAGAFGGTSLTALMDTLLGSSQGTAPYRGVSAWGGGYGGRLSLWSLTGIGGQKTGTTPATLLSGGSYTIRGSLTIPANTVVSGSRIGIQLHGDLFTNAGDTLTWTIKLGSATVLTGTGSAFTTSLGAPGFMWFIRDCWLHILNGGASGLVRGTGTFAGASSSSTTGHSGYLSTAGSGNASTAVNVNWTNAQTFDILVNFSSANAANQVRLLAGGADLFF